MPRRIYDISVVLGREAVVYPGDPPFSRMLFLRHGQDGCESASLRLSAHSGTHIDFPAHFLPGGKRLDDYGPERFILPALVIDAGNAKSVAASVLEDADIRPGDAVLFKTSNSTTGRSLDPEHFHDFVNLSPGAAYRLTAMGVSLAGIDACSIEGADNPAYPVHNILLSAGVLILEGLNLAEVSPGRYILACPPLKIAGAEGAPARALLMDDDLLCPESSTSA